MRAPQTSSSSRSPKSSTSDRVVNVHHDPAQLFTVRSGTVTAFDDHVGAGTITDGATGEGWYVHCTRLANGDRFLAVGTAVTFRAEPGPTGQEAVAVTPR